MKNVLGHEVKQENFQSSCKIPIRQAVHTLPVTQWPHVCLRMGVGLIFFPHEKHPWLHTVYQVLYCCYNSPTLFPEQKRMQWVELLTHLLVWQGAQLVWWGKWEKTATHYKSNRAMFCCCPAPALATAAGE